MSALDKLVPLDLTYLTLGEDGPEEVTETWYLYYTQGSVSAMYKKLGIDEQAIMDAHDALDAQDLDDENATQQAEEELQALTETIDMTELEAMTVMLWSGMLWHANQKGRTLTIDEVSHMLDRDNMEAAAKAWGKAFMYFTEGRIPSDDELDEMADDQGEDASGKD